MLANIGPMPAMASTCCVAASSGVLVGTGVLVGRGVDVLVICVEAVWATEVSCFCFVLIFFLFLL